VHETGNMDVPVCRVKELLECILYEMETANIMTEARAEIDDGCFDIVWVTIMPVNVCIGTTSDNPNGRICDGRVDLP